jgi:glucose-6-phosphate isomerase
MISFKTNNNKINDEILTLKQQIESCHERLHSKTGLGNDFLGWIDWPNNITNDEIDSIKKISDEVRKEADILIVVGIGGSYLGARAAIEMLEPLEDKEDRCEIKFAGKDLSSYEILKLLKDIENKSIYINVISKSGTTTEPAIAFRILMKWMNEQYSKEEVARRIIVTTDSKKGALRELGIRKSFRMFSIPDDIGGRYSVLTSVGLLPIACSGVSIDEILNGARDIKHKLEICDFSNNDCYKYAASRYLLYKQGKKIETFIYYEPRMHYFAEWLKQLFGESEGKEHKGLFPSACTFTTDLHSLGQFIQEGTPILFETLLKIEEDKDIEIPFVKEDLDGLNYLAGKSLSYVNEKALEGTLMAHQDGGVSNLIISIEKLDAYNVGKMFYFFEKACGIGAYLLEVNPFNQPGVEAYKKNMFKLLGKEK